MTPPTRLMALSAEERAILELLHDRGLSYEEIDELLGEPGEARRRERAALAALGEEEAAAEVDSTPAPTGGARRRWLRLGGGVLAAVAVGLGAGAIVEGGSDEPSETTASAPAEEPPDSVRVALEATEAGGQARGEAVIGLDDRFEPVLDLDLADLPPAPQGASYVVWIDLGGGRGLPVPEPIAVEDGVFRGRLDLAPQLISVIDVARELEIMPLGGPELEELSRQVRAGGPRWPGACIAEPRWRRSQRPRPGAVAGGARPTASRCGRRGGRSPGAARRPGRPTPSGRSRA